MAGRFLGIDCGSVSLNLSLINNDTDQPISIYLRTQGKPLQAFVQAMDQLLESVGCDAKLMGAVVTGSGRELLAGALGIETVNEITAHAVGAHKINSRIRTIIEIGGQDSKYIRIEPSTNSSLPRIPVFRMNEICAAGTGAFLDEQAERLGIGVESFGPMALESKKPAPIAGRCAVFAKSDMIHQAQEGTPLTDILAGLAAALVRNYLSTLIKGDRPVPVVSLQGGVMRNLAVVHAFRQSLGLVPEDIIVPPHFDTLGALGCAQLASQRPFRSGFELGKLIRLAQGAMKSPPARSFFQPLKRTSNSAPFETASVSDRTSWKGPLIMGLDVGSVSAKGVVIDIEGNVLAEDYRLSMSKPLAAVSEVLIALMAHGLYPEVISVTGSGRTLVGRLLDADLIVNEISAQSRFALQQDPDVDTVVEIGGQDSKWIAFENGQMVDFEMNRVCAAGTGSFLMAQSHRLGLEMGPVFSDAAFAANKPADLGCRCTVFMESDLIHHQNNGASSSDLAAGVCISIVQNYLEKVANNNGLGTKILFMGGVAATPAVKAAFEQYTGKRFNVPPFFRVSGAYGAALLALDKAVKGDVELKNRETIDFHPEDIRKDQFSCGGCANKCRIRRYKLQDRIIFNGGLCDRWEAESRLAAAAHQQDLFSLRSRLLESSAGMEQESDERWAMIRSPQYYEYFPFWRGFLAELRISLIVAPPPDRKQFETGLNSLRVETCLPIKVMAGQINSLVKSGFNKIFHPAVLSERPLNEGEKSLEYCPYIQASSQFFKGVFDVEWIEPIVNGRIDPDSFKKEHIRLATALGFSHATAVSAYERGMDGLLEFESKLRQEGEEFLKSLSEDDKALIILGKPYHMSEPFLNMNLGSLLQRLGIKAISGDLFPISRSNPSPVIWKYQARMIQVAREIAEDQRLFPVFTSFFGCGPDSFTLRHIRDALSGKPLLSLEMDEHSSRAGLITRIEAFWDRALRERHKKRSELTDNSVAESDDHSLAARNGDLSGAQAETTKKSSPKSIYLPYWGDHVYAFAAAAMSIGIEAKTLPPPDEESERLGRPHVVGGECHPFVLVLGDYLKLAKTIPADSVDKSRFYMINPDACRLGQFPVYIEKIRRRLGLSLAVIDDIRLGLDEFQISQIGHQKMLLRLWEGLNSYDLLCRLFFNVRPYVKDQLALEVVYDRCRNKLFESLKNGRVREGLEEALHELYLFPLDKETQRPTIVVTGDYYTRVVPFANNDVFRAIEAIGGCVMCPPTLSDSFKLGIMRDFVWSLLSGRSKEAARHGLLYTLMTILELNVRSSKTARRLISSPMDLMGLGMWRTVTNHAHTKLPAGITAPIATTLKDLDSGADGVLNLITLNCSYGTVVTAALIRALRTRPEIPMLTLVYDGLKKTNEKTRIEAFMEQARDHMERRLKKENESPSGATLWRRLKVR
ncbi:MAG: acyl-CoA dehydratase activase [Desulfomonilaceae bacterium]